MPLLRYQKLFQRSIQHLLIVPRFRGVEGLAAEELEIGLVEVGHGQLPRTEGLIFELQFAVGGVVAVLAVAEDGTADACHVRPSGIRNGYLRHPSER